jgi:predicted nucleotide-binding protein (sugar kinase/HSP70/actin superfamily)
MNSIRREEGTIQAPLNMNDLAATIHERAERPEVSPDAEPQTEHYRAYSPQPFTKAERSDVTILFDGLHWRSKRVIEAALESLGYNARSLPAATREALIKGREVADIGQCCPTAFTAGNLINFLEDESARIGTEAVMRNYVYLTVGSCGACRFGQYHQSYELALRNSGFDAFRLFLIAQDGLDQEAVPGGGLELDMQFLLGALWAVLCSDVIQDIEYQTRPYEVVPGATDQAVNAAVDDLCEAFRKRPHRGRGMVTLAWYLTTGYFRDALKRACRHFDEVRVDRLRVKPKVKITGEFYLQTVEGAPNYDIHRWLEQEGAEVYPAATAIWIDYMIRLLVQHFDERRGVERFANAKRIGIWLLSRLFRRACDRLRGGLLDVPYEMPEQDELRRLAAPYYDRRLSGGEGDMLIGKALWAHLGRKAHMICELSPYSCMPGTMSVGAMAAVQGKHPDLLYAPIEIKGDSEVHALSRCQMILSEATKRARQEFESALEATGLDEQEARRLLDTRPEMSRVLYRVPRRGAAGTAANIVLALGGRQL